MADPKIYVLVIGVSEYGLDPLPHAQEKARLFAEQARTTFRVEPEVLLNRKADLNTIKDRLDTVVAHLPPNSLFIFYFAGHGAKSPLSTVADEVQAAKVYLRLFGSSPATYRGYSIEADDILRTVTSTPLLNALVFVDCCYSGAQGPRIRSALRGVELQVAKVRAMALASSSGNETSVKGQFTDALINVWTNKPFECLPPTEFVNKVEDYLRLVNQNVSVTSLIPCSISRCWVSLGQPGCLLVVTFEDIPLNPLDFWFPNHPRPEKFRPDDEDVFFRQVALEDLALRIEYHGKFVTNFLFRVRDLTNSFRVVRVKLPADMIERRTAKGRYSYSKSLGDFIEAYGGRPAAEVVETAKLYAIMTGGEADFEMLAKVKRFNPDNAIYRLAACKAWGDFDASERQRLSSIMPLNQITAELNALGRKDLAEEFGAWFWQRVPAQRLESMPSEGSSGLGPALVSQGSGAVNVRGKPALSGEVITRLNRGDRVIVLEEVALEKPKHDEPAKWAKIALPTNVAVWAHASFIDPTHNIVIAKRLNLRAGPSENYSVIGRIEKGATVKPIEQKGEWVKLEPPADAYGFVAAHLLSRDTSAWPLAAGSPPGAAPRPIETAVPANASPAPASDAAAPPTTAANTAPPIETLPGAAPPEERLIKRIVTREGVVERSVSIQAPSYFILQSLDTKKAINYLYSPATNVMLKDYRGQRIVVTGEEVLDERWPNTPVIEIEKIETIP